MDKKLEGYLDGFSSLDDALLPKSFHEETEIAERQLFMTPGQMVARRFFRNKMAVIGVVMLIVMALFCYAAPLFYEYSEKEQFYLSNETGEELRAFADEALMRDAVLMRLEKPNNAHPLGTNDKGQDMLSRLMYGGRVSLMVGFIVVFIALVLGILIGGLAGYYGRWLDNLLMRIVEIFSAIPTVPLMLIVSSLLVVLKISPSQKIYYTMYVLGLMQWTGVARLVRGNILSLRESEYMQAADATGIKAWNKIMRHLIPNTLPNLIVTATLNLGGVILTESTLSFLGVGVGTPYASWGNMVSAVADSTVMRQHPNLWVAPGLCILVTVLAFNFVGDGLRDATDPRMKR